MAGRYLTKTQIEANYAPHYIEAVTFEEVHAFLYAARFSWYENVSALFWQAPTVMGGCSLYT